MSLSDLIAAAGQLEAALDGKQPLGPILSELASGIADAQLALGHFAKAVAAMAAVLAEMQPAAETAATPHPSPGNSHSGT